MIVLLSPTKTMKQMPYKGAVSEPAFMDRTTKIVEQLKSLDARQLQIWYGVSEKIAQEAFINWQRFDSLQKTIALYAYQGEAFRNLDAKSLTKSEIMKVNKHLRILSALYGILQPLNEICPYRLDLTKSFMSLGSGVKFWQEVITDKLIEEIKTHKHPIIVNCSSNEYTQLIDIPRVMKVANWIQVNVEFIKDGQKVSVSMLTKAARGTLAKELSLRPITSILQMNRYLADFDCEIDKKHGVVTYTKTI
jgi:uncharacterized protein